MKVTWPTIDGPMGGAETVLQISDADGRSLAKIPPNKKDGNTTVNVIDPYPKNTSMVFSIWWKCNGTSTTISVNVLGKDAEATITNEWQRYILVVENPGEERLITFLPEAGAPEIYMAMAQLEVGSFASDWRDATEDFATSAEFNIFKDEINGKVEQIGLGYSMFRQRADSIELFVSGDNAIAVDNDEDQTYMQITKDGMSVDSGGETFMRINEDGFVVNSGSTTTMTIGKESFQVDTDVIELNVPNNSLRIDNNGASMDNLTVSKNFYAPNLPRFYSGPTVVNIGTSYQFPTLSSFAKTINYTILNKVVNVTVHSHTYERVEFTGIIGGGRLNITYDDDWELHGRIAFFNCFVPIYVSLMRVISPESTSPADNVLDVYACQYVSFTSCYFFGGHNDTGIVISRGASVYFANCTFEDANPLITVDVGCRLTCNTIKGGSADGVYLVGAGATILWCGSRPQGSSYFPSTNPPCVTVPADLDNDLTPVGDSTTVPATDVQQTTLTATLTATAYSGNSFSSSARWMSEASLRQGKLDGDQYGGYVKFADLSALNGKTIKSAIITLCRNPDTGTSDPIAAHLYATPLTGSSGNPMSGAFYIGDMGDFVKGEPTDYSSDNLVTAIQGIVNGNYGGLFIYINDTSTPYGSQYKYSRNYGKFFGTDGDAPTLTVAYT